MDDQKLPVEQVDTSPVQEDVQSSSVGAEQVEETPQGQTDVSSGASENVKSSQEQPSQKGESRLERRIERLQEKLQSAKTDEDRQKISSLIQRLKAKVENTSQIPPELMSALNEPLIKPEEYGGEIDPAELERRIAQREQAVVMKAVSTVENKRRYEQALQEHISDWEKVMNEEEVKNDPDLRQFIEEQYRIANFAVSPLTGEEDFFPTLKPSEVYARVKRILEKRATVEGAKTLSQLQSQSQESSIPPSVTKPKAVDAEEQALLQQARSEGSEEAWAKYLKRRLFKK